MGGVAHGAGQGGSARIFENLPEPKDLKGFRTELRGRTFVDIHRDLEAPTAAAAVPRRPRGPVNETSSGRGDGARDHSRQDLLVLAPMGYGSVQARRGSARGEGNEGGVGAGTAG